MILILLFYTVFCCGNLVQYKYECLTGSLYFQLKNKKRDSRPLGLKADKLKKQYIGMLFLRRIVVNNIHVVLDSTARIPAELLKQHKNLHKVSLKIRVADKEWNEDELPYQQLFAELDKAKTMPQTSQPPLGEFVELFQKLVDEDAEVIVITVSGALSGTAEGARTAARSVDAKKIHVIDSETADIGQLRIAEAALQMIAEGLDCVEIVQSLKDRVRATHTMILPDSLEHLHKGGRIGGAATLLGTILQIKPVLYLTEGKISVLDKVRTRKRAMNRMIDEVAKCERIEYVGVVHAGASEEDCLELKKRVQELYPYMKVTLTETSSVVAAHTGPKALALIYQEKL